eukprot:3623414-Heterocapsa_arctica.AAC.1
MECRLSYKPHEVNVEARGGIMPSPTAEVGATSSTSASSAGPGHSGRTVAGAQAEEVDPPACHQPPQ